MEIEKNTAKFSLLKELNAIQDAGRENRIKVAKTVLKDQALFESLLEIAFEQENELSIKAIWVLELPFLQCAFHLVSS